MIHDELIIVKSFITTLLLLLLFRFMILHSKPWVPSSSMKLCHSFLLLFFVDCSRNSSKKLFNVGSAFGRNQEVLSFTLLRKKLCLFMVYSSLALHVRFVAGNKNADVLIVGMVPQLCNPFLHFIKGLS